jgi:hypothetical protein
MNTDHALHAVFTYNVRIEAYCLTEGSDVSVSIIMDGTPTGYTTPHNFTLIGTHTFTVPGRDASNHPFNRWSTFSTSTTLTVDSSGTYTAFYLATVPPPGVGGLYSIPSKFALLAPYVGLVSAILVGTVVAAACARRVRSKNKEQ